VTVDFNAASEKINSAILLAVQAGSIGVAILLRAVRDSRISLHISQPENAPSFKNWAKTTAHQPAICLIGDDDGRQLGAAAWKGFAFRMVRWSSHVLLHCAGAEPGHYEGAVRVAEEGGRVLVIETNPASAPSWLRVLAAIPRRKTLIIWPRDGVHPVPDDLGRAH
jgi:hypothetical protein